MTERERIERVVEKAVCLPGCDVMTTTLCAKLIRRELAKRDARVRRIVKSIQGSDAHEWVGGQIAMVTDTDGEWIRRKDLLAALRGK